MVTAVTTGRMQGFLLTRKYYTRHRLQHEKFLTHTNAWALVFHMDNLHCVASATKFRQSIH